MIIAHDITERKRLENEWISVVSHELGTALALEWAIMRCGGKVLC